MPNYDAVIDKLLEKSLACSTVPWKPTVTEDTFIAALEGDFTFEVSKLEDGGFGLRMKDNDDRKIIDLTYNRGPNWGEDNRYFDRIERLFEAARVTGLEVDKKLAVAESILDRF